jgi:hypothetical protein
LSKIIQPAALTATGATIADSTARSSFGLFVLHRSKLNVSDLVRKIAQQCSREGLVKPTEDVLRRDRGYLFPASVQLLIGLILEGEKFRDRIEDDAWYMQLAINALYLISREWEAGRDRVRTDRKVIVDALLARWGRNAIEEPTAAEKALLELGVGSRDLDVLSEALDQLAGLLCDRDKRELFLVGKFAPEETHLSDIFPPDMLLENIAPKEHRFLFDIYGQDIATRTALAEAAQTEAAVVALPEQISAQIDSAVEFSVAFYGALAAAGIEIADLAALRILPPTIDFGVSARGRLQAARATGTPYPDLAKDLPVLVSIRTWVEQHGRALAVLLYFAQQVAWDARKVPPTPRDGPPSPPPPLVEVLRAVSRYVDITRMFTTTDPLGPLAVDWLPFRLKDVTVVPSGDLAHVRAWEDELKRPRKSLLDRLPSLASVAWFRWLSATQAYLLGSDGTQVKYEDIVFAAADMRPGNLFRGDLRQMSISEWSELCLSAFPGSEAPFWPFIVGLRALGFGRSILFEAYKMVRDDTGIDVELELLNGLVRMAPENTSPGFVLVMRDDGMSIASTAPHRPEHSGQAQVTPVLALPEGNLQLYDLALGWLASQRAITRLVYELE